ncbi:MAG: ABC transporter ATP-binding protein [Stappiaceae bacterium]
MANIVLSDVTKKFGAFTAVDRVSAQISDGEFVTLLGPSGCGKTTLLNLISGFLEPDGGTISIGEDDVSALPPEKRDTAMCFQSYALFPHLSVHQNIAFGLKQKGWKRSDVDQRVQELGGQLDLTANFPKLPNQLSGGQQQRVALGRALAVRPGVILFDEPLSNLDAKLRESVRFEIRKIQSEAKLTAIYVTHDQSEALAMSDRIFVLNAGRIEQAGNPHEIYNAPATRFVADFIGAANLIEGEVVGEESAGRWLFDTPIGRLCVECGAAPSAKRHHICWRPEDALVEGDTSNNANRLDGAVGATAFQGAYTDVFVTINGISQRLHVGGAFAASGSGKGDGTLTFRIPETKIHVLEPVA